MMLETMCREYAIQIDGRRFLIPPAAIVFYRSVIICFSCITQQTPITAHCHEWRCERIDSCPEAVIFTWLGKVFRATVMSVRQSGLFCQSSENNWYGRDRIKRTRSLAKAQVTADGNFVHETLLVFLQPFRFGGELFVF